MIALLNRKERVIFIYTENKELVERTSGRSLEHVDKILDEYEPDSYTFGSFTGHHNWTAYSRTEKLLEGNEKVISELIMNSEKQLTVSQ